MVHGFYRPLRPRCTETQKFILNPEQLKPIGVGIREPIVPLPRSLAEAKKNMRVEFSIVEVRAEAITFEEL